MQEDGNDDSEDEESDPPCKPNHRLLSKYTSVGGRGLEVVGRNYEKQYIHIHLYVEQVCTCTQRFEDMDVMLMIKIVCLFIGRSSFYLN